jgi:uncharacterized protein (TIGR02246 family)
MAVSAPIGGADGKGTAMNDEAQIRALLDERCTALRDGDAKSIVAQYTDDPVVYTLAPPLRQSAQDALDVAALQQWLDEKGGSVKSELRDVAVTVDGDLALCTALECMGSPDDAPGTPFVLWFRSTYGLRRVDGQWRIAHEHTSTPFYMDGSLRAALDLQP